MKKSTNKTNNIKEQMLLALEKSLGNVKKACEMCKVGRTTYYEWLEKDPDFKMAVDYISEHNIDFVESKMYERIAGYTHPEVKLFNYKGTIIKRTVQKHYPPDSGLIAFFLETKAKHRGYVKKSIIENATQDPFEGMTEAELDDFLAKAEIEDEAEAKRMQDFRHVAPEDEANQPKEE